MSRRPAISRYVVKTHKCLVILSSQIPRDKIASGSRDRESFSLLVLFFSPLSYCEIYFCLRLLFKRKKKQSALLLYLIIELNKRIINITGILGDVNGSTLEFLINVTFHITAKLQDVMAAIVTDYITSTDLNNSSCLCKCYSIRFGSYSLSVEYRWYVVRTIGRMGLKTDQSLYSRAILRKNSRITNKKLRITN